MKTRQDLLGDLRRTMGSFVGQTFTEEMRQRIRMDAALLIKSLQAQLDDALSLAGKMNVLDLVAENHRLHNKIRYQEAEKAVLKNKLVESQHREEAVEDLRDTAYRPCRVCKNWGNGRCVSPNKDRCAGFNLWQWRGLAEPKEARE